MVFTFFLEVSSTSESESVWYVTSFSFTELALGFEFGKSITPGMGSVVPVEKKVYYTVKTKYIILNQ